jgi:NADH-quinone oxidoreductase subunit I
MASMLKESWDLLFSLITGLAITLRQMFVRPFTVQYPDECVVWPERTRGRLVMPRDSATGTNRCTACLMCEKICPNGSIEIKVRTDEHNKRKPEDFLHHLDRCSYCGLCVETCPFNALRMSREYEIAVRDKSRLKRHLQDETLVFDERWRGGLPAKADQSAPAAVASPPTGGQA